MYSIIQELVPGVHMCGKTFSMFVCTFLRVYSPDLIPLFQSSSVCVCAFVYGFVCFTVGLTKSYDHKL